MKKLFLVAGMIALSCTAFAQDMSYGVRAGLNMANVSGDDVDDSDPRMGAVIGGFVNFALTEKISIQPELQYSMQGATLKLGDLESDLTLDYLNVPVLAGYSIMEGLSVQTGPQLGLLLSAEQEDFQDGEMEDVKDNFTSTDFAWVIGGSYDLNNLNFSVRYNMGLASVGEEVGGESNDIKNGVIQLSVGYRF